LIYPVIHFVFMRKYYRREKVDLEISTVYAFWAPTPEYEKVLFGLPFVCLYIVTCILIARQWLGKHVPAVNTPQQSRGRFLCGRRRDRGAVNTTKIIRDNRRRCFPWGPCRVVIKKCSAVENSSRTWWVEFETPACRDVSLELNWVISCRIRARRELGCAKKTSCVIWSYNGTVINPLPRYD
jgi:hypothetical protein